MDDIRNEYHMLGNDVSIGRLADIAGVADNIGAFYGKNYLNRFGNANPNFTGTTPGFMPNSARYFDVTVRICIGINGSASSNPSVGWIWSKSNGSNGGNIYIYNNTIYVTVGNNTTTVLSYPIPSSWTNNETREIVWASNSSVHYLRVDGVVRGSTSQVQVPFVGTKGYHHFLSLPNSGDIGTAVPSAARVNPANIVAGRCDVWTSYYT